MVARLEGKVDGRDVAFVRKHGAYIVELTAWDDAGNYCFVLKWLLMFDPSSLCAHLIPCPYQAEVVPPLFYAELLQPACGRR